MDVSDPTLVLLRALHVAALCFGFGSLVALLVLAPAGTARFAIIRLAMIALVAGLLTLVPWFAWQSAAIAEISGLGELPGAMTTVLMQTWFGTVVFVSGLLLASALLLCRFGLTRWALLPAALALVSEAASGHAVNGKGFILAAEILHLLAAGAWLGALPALFLLLRGSEASLMAQRFSGLGMAAVGIIAGSALALASAQIGGLGGLFGTGYGRVILLKLGLFAVLLAMACLNRVVLTPMLGRKATILRTSVLVEIVLGFSIVTVASWLAALPPAVHQQPVWPFAWRPSLAIILQAVNDAPQVAAEPVLAAMALAVVWSLVVVAAMWHREWKVSFVVAVLVTIFSVPHLAPLLVPAYPTSFYRSTTTGDATSVAAGAVLFAANCAACHGPVGRGDGPLTRSLAVPPADLTAQHLLDHEDGELFWWISHGIDRAPGPDGVPRQAMPGFAGSLDDISTWQLIDFIRANNPYLNPDTRNRSSGGAPHAHTN
jgi:putative copper export protein/mono/diheme cytochrome c family protein